MSSHNDNLNAQPLSALDTDGMDDNASAALAQALSESEAVLSEPEPEEIAAHMRQVFTSSDGTKYGIHPAEYFPVPMLNREQLKALLYALTTTPPPRKIKRSLATQVKNCSILGLYPADLRPTIVAFGKVLSVLEELAGMIINERMFPKLCKYPSSSKSMEMTDNFIQ